MKKSVLFHLCVRTFVILCLLCSLNGCRTSNTAYDSGPIDKERASIQPSNRTREVSSPALFAKHVQQIALLLPMSGKNAEAAKAIREGFLASYYEKSYQNLTKPTIRIYDTQQATSVIQLYETAIHEGADIVVGPLTKEDVSQLGNLPSSQLTIPVLALNNHAAIRSTNKPFFQFSLTPEEEAEQLAHKAMQKGFQQAAVIVPDNPWGKRIAHTFTQHWQRQGGEVMEIVYANPSQDQAALVRRLLKVEKNPSNKPKSGNTKTQTPPLPRRRQDIDVIVMAAPPEQARQLKPLFDFYYADDLPVFATSSVYSGHPNPKRDRDLNGVIFCDMPWLLNANRGQAIHQLLKQQEGRQTDQYTRLFAMGVDAYHLASRLKQLQQGSAYPGATGDLSLNTQNEIQRHLLWAKIKEGIPVAYD